MNFINKYFKRFLFFITIFILIVLIGLTSVGRIKTTNGGFFGDFISSLQKISFNIGQTLTNSFYSVHEIVKMKEENIMLTETVHELQEQVRVLENIVNKSEALENEYTIKKNLTYDYEIGQVIALDNSNWFSKFTVDKGENDGINKNDIVIYGVETDDGIVQIGLVGLITETGSNWSKVITLLDESCKISFRDINNDESGILQGSISGDVSGYFFNSKSIASIGDSIVTSGIGEVYLPDLFIGKVIEFVQTTDASTHKIIIKPAVDFTKLNKVFILKTNR
ncbi:MAG: rod shape-determining protein MreC [Tissierellia bacterium]|nr:rod shape-determining protein MreC [Tissierellia bacterium]MDD4780653.1 rod shape-determining protein MreC [Tissierellia bacterium]